VQALLLIWQHTFGDTICKEIKNVHPAMTTDLEYRKVEVEAPNMKELVASSQSYRYVLKNLIASCLLIEREREGEKVVARKKNLRL
jgi:hypothetical protein